MLYSPAVAGFSSKISRKVWRRKISTMAVTNALFYTARDTHCETNDTAACAGNDIDNKKK